MWTTDSASPYRRPRLPGQVLLLLLAGCREECPDLSEVPCYVPDHLYCDPCGQAWLCEDLSPRSVRVASDLDCDCRDEDGLVDTSDPTCATE